MSEDEVHNEDKPAPFMPMNAIQLVQVIILGVVVGLCVWGLTFFLETYVLKAVLCQGNQTAKCALGPQYAEATATILAAGVGLYVLVKLQIFRPLLVVLGTVISLWGILGMIATLPWYGRGLACVLLYACAYMLFVWIARIRMFWLVVAVMLGVVITVRLILTA